MWPHLGSKGTIVLPASSVVSDWAWVAPDTPATAAVVATGVGLHNSSRGGWDKGREEFILRQCGACRGREGG